MLNADSRGVQLSVLKVGVSMLHYSLILLTLTYNTEPKHFKLCFYLDNVEFILNSTAVRHCSDSQDTDPDYDKVASDDDTDQELPSSKEERTKVFSH